MKVTRERSRTHYCLDGYTGTNGWDILILEQYEVYEQLKERETRDWDFLPDRSKEKKEYRIYSKEHLPRISVPFLT